MRTGWKMLLWVVCGVLISAGCVMAQELSKGPYKASVSLRADYTDNRDSLSDDVKEDNVDLYIKPRFDYHGDWNRSFLDFFYAPAYRYRTEPSDIQNEDEFWHDAYIGGEYSLRPGFAVRALDKLDYSDDPEVTSDSGSVRRDESFLLNRTEIGANYEASANWVADVLGRYLDKNYTEDVVAEDSDETRADAQVMLTRRMAPDFSVFAKSMYSDFGFESSKDLNRDFTSILGALGCEKILNQQLVAGASAGVQVQDFDDAAIDADSVPYASVWARGQTIPSVRLAAEVTHGLRDADAYPYASQIYTDTRARIDWDAAPRTTLTARGEYRLSSYEDQIPTADDSLFVGDAGGDETRIIGEVSATYKLTQTSRIMLAQQYEDLSSDVATEFTKNTTRLIFGRDF